MANSSENSQINESAIVENDQGIIAAVNPAIDKLQSNVITLEDNEFPVVGNEFLIKKTKQGKILF